jgi:hypothetical protein
MASTTTYIDSGRNTGSASSSPSRSRRRALGWRRRQHQSATTVRSGVRRRVSPSCTSATPSRCHRLHLRGYSASASRCTVSWDCPWGCREVIERELAAVDDLGEFTFDGSDIKSGNKDAATHSKKRVPYDRVWIV